MMVAFRVIKIDKGATFVLRMIKFFQEEVGLGDCRGEGLFLYCWIVVACSFILIL